MVIFWIVFGLVCLGSLLSLCWHDDWGVSIPGVMLSILFGMTALFMGVWIGALHVDRATCHSWAQKTGRPTKFAYYNVFTWECLTKAHDGRWVPKDSVGDYNK